MDGRFLAFMEAKLFILASQRETSRWIVRISLEARLGRNHRE